MRTAWDPSKARLIAEIDVMEAETRSAKEMVRQDRPVLDTLGALSRLRKDIKGFEALMISSRLERLSQAAAGNPGLELAMGELLDFVAPRRPRHLSGALRQQARGRAA